MAQHKNQMYMHSDNLYTKIGTIYTFNNYFSLINSIIYSFLRIKMRTTLESNSTENLEEKKTKVHANIDEDRG